MSTRDHLASLIGPVARELLGEPNKALSSQKELRFGARGSLSVDLEKGTWYDHETQEGGGLLDLITRETGRKGRARFDWLAEHGYQLPDDHRTNGAGHSDAKLGPIIATYDYVDEAGTFLFQVTRHFPPKDFRQRTRDAAGEWVWSVRGVRQVPYRLPELVEALSNNNLVFVVEGEKDADNLWRLGAPATTNAGGVGKWREELSKFFSGADVVVIADNDPQARHKKTGELLFHEDGRPKLPGQDHAHDVARQLSGVASRVRLLDLGKVWPACPPKGDISNWIEAGHSVEQLFALVEQLPDWSPEAPKPARFLPIPIDQVEVGADPPYLIADMIPAGPSLIIVVGKDKSRKTYLAMDVLFHVAMRRPYCGRAIQQAGSVVYITSEGRRGVDRRLVALRRHYGVEGKSVPFYLIRDMPDFGEKTDLGELVARLRTIPGPIAAIAIDPLIRAIPGKSDSEPKDMSPLIDNCEALGREFNCVVMVPHHAPRSDETRSRGTNMLDGAADSMWSVVKVGEESTVTIYRMKDGPDGLTWKFRLDSIVVGQDRNSRTCCACVCAITQEPTVEDQGATTKGPKLSAPQRRFLDILKKAVDEAGAAVPGTAAVPTGARAVTRDMLKKYLIAGGFFADEKPNHIRARISTLLNSMAAKQLVGLATDHIWLPK
jgi:AAA domain